MYLGRALCGDGKTEKDLGLRRRAQAGANTCIESSWGCDGGPADLKKTEWQGHEHLRDVTSACLYGTETLAMTKQQLQRLQMCENNWVWKIARVARADRSACRGPWQRNWWGADYSGQVPAGHVGRMADDRLPKRAAELREEGRMRRGRPRLRWEDYVERDARKAGEEEDWKKKTRDKGGWKRLSDEAVKKLRTAPYPWQGEKRKERERERETQSMINRIIYYIADYLV